MRQLTLLFLACLLTACGPVKVPQVNDYAIHSSSHLVLAKRATRASLIVSVPQAVPELRSNEMLYMMKPYELKSFAKHEWVAQPAQMLQPLITQSLKNSGYFKAVVSEPTTIDASYRISSTVLALKQSFLSRPSHVTISLKVDVINESNDKAIASRTFTTTARANGDNPYGGVLAANSATRQLLEKVVRFVVASVRHPV